MSESIAYNMDCEVWRLTEWKNFHGNIAINDDCMEIMKTLPDKAFELAIV